MSRPWHCRFTYLSVAKLDEIHRMGPGGPCWNLEAHAENGVPSPQIFYFNRTAWDNSESESWQSCVLCRQCSAELVWVCMLCFICVQVISAYREVVNNLYLDDVTEKWSAVLNQLEKFELEIGSGKYFGGEEIGISWTAECENYLCVEMCHCFLRANSFDICSRELCFQLFQFAANIVSHVS